MARLLLFSARTSDHGWELWRSDGGGEGTRLVDDLVPGARSSDPYAMAAADGRAWFFANAGDRPALWSSDGSAAGTQVADPLAGLDAPGGLALAGGAVFFAAADGSHGRELWAFRPGQGAAAMVADLVPGGGGSDPVPVGTLDGRLVFAAADDGARALWRSDGTAEGTERLTPDGIAAADIRGAVIDGALHFVATDPVRGSQIWRTDGSVAGTVPVADLDAVPDADAATLAALGGVLLFTAGTSAHGQELWRLDGDAAALVADIQAGPVGSAPRDFAALDGILYFSADDGERGRELWRTDGTAPGTRLVADIAAGAGGSDPAGLVAADGRLYFSANGGGGFELWASDGTAAGTVLVADIAPSGSSRPAFLTVIDQAAPAADTDPPDTFVETGPMPVDPSPTAVFDLGSDEADATFQTSLDGGPWQDAADPATFAALAPGSHLLLVRAVDAAGNADPTPARYPWAVGAPSPDAEAPDTRILSGPPANGAGETASFVFGSDEAAVGYEAAIDGGPFLPVVNPLDLQGLAPGPHALLARAVDPSGRADATPAIHRWFVGRDLEPPDTTILSGPTDAAAAIAVLDLFATEAGAWFEMRLDEGGWQPASDPLPLFALAAGAHRVEVRAIDAAGQADASPASWSWTVDHRLPAADAGPQPAWGGAEAVVHSDADAALLTPDAGIVSVDSYVSLRLPGWAANVALLGADGLNADGNALANAMVGNAAANILAAHEGNDSLAGGGGADFLAAGAADDTVWGDEGGDTVWGGQGNDRILGGAGQDLLNGDRGADTLLGGEGDDAQNGGPDGDRLQGEGGDDVLHGGQGGDLLLGGAGADLLSGDRGADTLWGGEGGDLFVATAGDAVDVISDFAPGLDRLQLSAETGIVDEATFRDRAHDAGGTTLLDLSHGGWLVLLGIRPGEIAAADLVIV